MNYECADCGLSSEDLVDDVEEEAMEYLFSFDGDRILCLGCEGDGY